MQRSTEMALFLIFWSTFDKAGSDGTTFRSLTRYACTIVLGLGFDILKMHFTLIGVSCGRSEIHPLLDSVAFLSVQIHLARGRQEERGTVERRFLQRVESNQSCVRRLLMHP